MLTLVRDVLVTAFVPGRTYRRWLDRPKALRRGFMAAAGSGFLFALTSLGLAASGAVPLVPPIYRMPDDNHYFWQMIFIVPAILLAWAVAAGLLRLFGPRGGPRSLFVDAVSLAGPSLALPLFLAWIPQAAQTVLMILGMRQEEFVEIVSPPGLWQTLDIGLNAAACVLGVILFSFAARISQSTGRLRSGLAGALVVGVVGTLFILFVR